MSLNFDKLGGILPAIIQDAQTNEVLMLGFMNQEAYKKTLSDGKVTFFPAPRNVCGQKGRRVGITWMLLRYWKIVMLIPFS